MGLGGESLLLVGVWRARCIPPYSLFNELTPTIETQFDTASFFGTASQKAVPKQRHLPSFDAPEFLTTRRRTCVEHFVVNHVVSSCVEINQ